MQIFQPALLFVTAFSLAAAAPPSVGQKAADFSLKNNAGVSIRLSDLTAKSTVALVVLRGYPGYQCPFCQRQVQDFVGKAQAFTDAGVQVAFIYPGPSDNLNAKADEFLANKNFPATFQMLLDPGYTFTSAYGLRWDEPKETAYPSIFLIDQQGTVFFSRVVKTHGSRITAAEVLDLIPKKKSPKP